MSTSTPTSMWVSYLLASSSPWLAPARVALRYTSMHHAMYGAYLRIKINMQID